MGPATGVVPFGPSRRASNGSGTRNAASCRLAALTSPLVSEATSSPRENGDLIMTEWSSMDCAAGVVPCGGVVKKDFQSITSWMYSCVACPRISAATVFLWVSCILAILITSGMLPGFTVRVALGCLVRAECWQDAHHFRCVPSGYPDPSFSCVEVCLCWPRFWLFLQNHMASCLQSSFRVLELLSCQLSSYHTPRSGKERVRLFKKYRRR